MQISKTSSFFVLTLSLGGLWGTAFPAAAQPVNLISITNAWKYDATTNDYGAAWKETGYDDSLWSGPSNALFLYDTSLAYVPAPTNTVVPLLYNSARIRAYYYRTTFYFPTNPAGAILFASNLVDDGAVIWLNGQEAGRIRMTGAVIARTNFATGTPPGGDATSYEVLTLTNHLVAGDNTLAVEVHQNSSTSPDTMFGLSLTVLLPIAPVITDDSQLTNRTVLQGRSTTLTLAAEGLPAPTYQWFLNDSPISGATNPTYFIDHMSGADGGSYFCQVSNPAGTTNSRTAVVSFEPDTVPPTLVYALADATLTNLLVSFSEPLDPTNAVDPFNFEIIAVDGSQVLDLERDGILVNATNVLLVTLPRTPGVYYKVVVNVVSDAQGVPIADHSSIPISVVAVAGDQQTWKVFQADTDPGPGWPDPGFDDSQATWFSAPAAFYAHRGSPVSTVPWRAQLNLTNPPGASTITIAYYFRTHFPSFTPAGQAVRLQLRHLVDDGAVFHLNGQEACRVRMPPAPAPIAYASLASHTVTDAEVGYEGPVNLPAVGGVNGDNVLAVEVHQSDLGSSDLYFAAELVATATPMLQVAYAGPGVTISWSGSGFVLMEADNPAGPWSDVMAPGRITSSPYIPTVPAARKFYALRLGP